MFNEVPEIIDKMKKLEDSIKELKTEEIQILNNRSEIYKATESLKKIKDRTPDLDLMIESLNIKYDNEFSKLNRIREEIKQLQESCPGHNMICIGNDSHYNYYECSICGKEEKD